MSTNASILRRLSLLLGALLLASPAGEAAPQRSKTLPSPSTQTRVSTPTVRRRALTTPIPRPVPHSPRRSTNSPSGSLRAPRTPHNKLASSRHSTHAEQPRLNPATHASQYGQLPTHSTGSRHSNNNYDSAPTMKTRVASASGEPPKYDRVPTMTIPGAGAVHSNYERAPAMKTMGSGTTVLHSNYHSVPSGASSRGVSHEYGSAPSLGGTSAIGHGAAGSASGGSATTTTTTTTTAHTQQYDQLPHEFVPQSGLTATVSRRGREESPNKLRHTSDVTSRPTYQARRQRLAQRRAAEIPQHAEPAPASVQTRQYDGLPPEMRKGGNTDLGVNRNGGYRDRGAVLASPGRQQRLQNLNAKKDRDNNNSNNNGSGRSSSVSSSSDSEH